MGKRTPAALRSNARCERTRACVRAGSNLGGRGRSCAPDDRHRSILTSRPAPACTGCRGRLRDPSHAFSISAAGQLLRKIGLGPGRCCTRRPPVALYSASRRSSSLRACPLLQPLCPEGREVQEPTALREFLEGGLARCCLLRRRRVSISPSPLSPAPHALEWPPAWREGHCCGSVKGAI